MTAIMFFGMSLYYAQFISLSFPKLNIDDSFTSITGTIFIFSGLLFKLGVAPFHSWMVDIYKKTTTIVILFMDTIWKFFMVFIFIKTFALVIDGRSTQHLLLLSLLSVVSMGIGAIMPIFEENIKKFIAYTATGHIGFILTVFVIAKDILSLSMVMSYLTTYCFAAICFFSTILIIKKHTKIENFNDLSGTISDFPILGFGILLSLFAMIGIPPFANFIAKMHILKSLINSQHYFLLNVSIIYSIMCLFYVAKCTRYLFKKNAQYNIPNPSKGNFLVTFEIIVLFILIFAYDKIEKFFASLLYGI
jgi:NADH:ubiquinone oxidoreductase subunit 2 (subunit N)